MLEGKDELESSAPILISYAWPSPHPPVLDQLRLWALIGLQSFGGGQATQLLIYQAVVERRRWMRPEEYTEAWALSQLPPGINLIAFQAIIGFRMGGALGVLLSLIGLLLPSIGVTILFTAFYAAISRSHLTGLALRGVIAAVAGMGVVMALRIGRPPLSASAKEGRLSMSISVGVLIAAIVAYVVLRAPAVVVFVGAGAAMVVLSGVRRRTVRPN